MARFSGGSGGGEGIPGPEGPAGPPGADANTGDITFDGIQIIGAGTAAGDGSNNGTIELVPDGDLNSDQYIIIDPTGPNHIHIRSGGTQDASNSELILGGERNKVAVSDLNKSVTITTAAIIENTYVNANEVGNADLMVPDTSDILIGDNIVMFGISYPVTYFSPDPNNTGFSIVRATGATFVAGDSYTFVREEPYENYWQFTSTGVFSGPAMGGVKVPAITNTGPDNDLYVYVNGSDADLRLVADQNIRLNTDYGDIVLNADGGEYIGNAESPANQIATLGDFGYLTISSATDPEEGPLTTLTAPSNLTIQTGGEPAGEITIQADKGLRINYSSEIGGAYLNGNEDYPETQIATIGDLSSSSTNSFQSVRYTPTFTATGLTFTGTGATHPTYNSYYVKQGKLVSFVIEVDMSTVTNFGTGQLKLQLPFTPQFGFNHFAGWCWADPDVSPDTGTGHTIINADTAGVTDVLDLHYLKSAGGANAPIREGLFLQGTPVTLTTISKIYINGTYIAAS